MRVNLQDDEGVEVQMAPLVDCVFLLLIFFLVATTLKKIDRELPLDLPESAAAIEVQQPDSFTIVSIDRNSGIYIDGTPVSLGLLQTDLRAKARADQNIKVRLDVDRQVEFQYAMQVLDLLRFEGLKNVSINSRRDTEAK